ncbi:hypothetical protein R1sor_002918 [Riccia sorocarpa]|uniref:Nucleolar complex protein 2 homolog n=1 Tax=Riccia sorocarpa TaxID=122646 RepID=A0ABD3H4A8_9MARC
MVKAKKGVKKYVRKHLGAELKLRKKLKPMKQALRRQAAAFKAKAGEEEELQNQDHITEKKPGKQASESRDLPKKGASEVSQHKKELNELAEKDPEFYEFLKQHDQELLDFEDEEEDEEEIEVDENLELPENEEEETDGPVSKEKEGPGAVITLTTAMIDQWSAAVKTKITYHTVRNLLQAFRTACHYGDSEEENQNKKYSLASGHVFNRIMVFVLVEMDGILRSMLSSNASGENPNDDNMPKDPRKSPRWKKIEPLVKSFLGNVLHILNQMTDNEMISFTLRRLKSSVPFLNAFPRQAVKFLKVALHFWGSGEGALPVIALFFIREMAMKVESHLDLCLKGIYKEYTANSRFVNATSLPRIKFRMSCVSEMYGIDFSASYQLAFVFIRQMAFILRNAMTVKTKDAFKKVYNWQYINSLHLWVKVLSTYAAQGDLQPLVYPLAQIIGGVARLVPTARYFPLRLQCVKMLNQLSEATGSFTPVAALVLDMLQFKELSMSPTGGAGKPVDFDTVLKVPKTEVKTRAFQDECVSSVVEQLGEHLAQWSYNVAFPELSVVPLLQLRHFMKKTTVERFRRQVKQLVEQVERNVVFIGKKRDGVTFSPKDSSSVQTFLQAEKDAGASPLSKYLVSLRERSQQRRSYFYKSSETVGDIKACRRRTDENEDDDDEDVESEGGHSEDEEQKAAKVFSKNWLPQKKSKDENKLEKSSANGTKAKMDDYDGNSDEEDGDIVEDLMLSSDDEEEENNRHVSQDESDDDDEEDVPEARRSRISEKKRGFQKSPGSADRSGKKHKKQNKSRTPNPTKSKSRSK